MVLDAIAGVSPAEAVERLLRVPGFRAEVYAGGDPIVVPLHPIMTHMGRVQKPLHVVDAVAPDALPGVSRPRHGENLA